MTTLNQQTERSQTPSAQAKKQWRPSELPSRRDITLLHPHASPTSVQPDPIEPTAQSPETSSTQSFMSPSWQLTYRQVGKFLKRPIVVVSLGVALSIGIGLSVLTIGYAMSQSSKAHPVSLMSMAPEPSAFADLETSEVIRLIDKTQAAISTQTNEKAKAGEEEVFSLLGLEKAVRELVPLASGRPDPFAPLVKEIPPSEVGSTTEAEAEEEKDVLADVMYTGFIKDVNTSNNTAIIKVGSVSVIKKAGETFYAEGAKILIKGVTQQQLNLVVNGTARTLPISVSYETAASATNMTLPSGGGSSSSPDNTGNSESAPPKAAKQGILKLDEL